MYLSSQKLNPKVIFLTSTSYNLLARAHLANCYTCVFRRGNCMISSKPSLTINSLVIAPQYLFPPCEVLLQLNCLNCKVHFFAFTIKLSSQWDAIYAPKHLYDLCYLPDVLWLVAHVVASFLFVFLVKREECDGLSGRCSHTRGHPEHSPDGMAAQTLHPYPQSLHELLRTQNSTLQNTTHYL